MSSARLGTALRKRRIPAPPSHVHWGYHQAASHIKPSSVPPLSRFQRRFTFLCKFSKSVLKDGDPFMAPTASGTEHFLTSQVTRYHDPSWSTCSPQASLRRGDPLVIYQGHPRLHTRYHKSGSRYLAHPCPDI